MDVAWILERGPTVVSLLDGLGTTSQLKKTVCYPNSPGWYGLVG